jgi:hypothetical protein
MRFGQSTLQNNNELSDEPKVGQYYPLKLKETLKRKSRKSNKNT